MHRYQPRVHVIEAIDVRQLVHGMTSTFYFPQTVFVAVTAYQNKKVSAADLVKIWGVVLTRLLSYYIFSFANAHLRRRFLWRMILQCHNNILNRFVIN